MTTRTREHTTPSPEVALEELHSPGRWAEVTRRGFVASLRRRPERELRTLPPTHAPPALPYEEGRHLLLRAQLL